jgi:hypothetical protein
MLPDGGGASQGHCDGARVQAVGDARRSKAAG